MENSYFGILIGTVLSVLAVILVFTIDKDKVQKEKAEKQYNHGICLECGGHYEYFDLVGHKNETYYIYKCDKCNNTVELTKLMK